MQQPFSFGPDAIAELNQTVESAEGMGIAASNTSQLISGYNKLKNDIIAAEQQNLDNQANSFGYGGAAVTTLNKQKEDMVSAVSYLSEVEMLKGKGEDKLRPLVFSIHADAFKRAAKAAGVDDSKKFLDSFFSNHDISKVSNYVKFGIERKALELEQIAQGVKDPKEVRQRVKNYFAQEHDQITADVVFGDYAIGSDAEAIDMWLRSTPNFTLRQIVDFYRGRKNYQPEGKTYSTTSGVIGAEYQMPYDYKMDREDVVRKQLLAVELGIAALSVVTGGAASIPFIVGDAGIAGYTAVTGQDALQSIAFKEEHKINQYNGWLRALASLGVIVPGVSWWKSGKLANEARVGAAAVSEAQIRDLVRGGDEILETLDGSDKQLLEILREVKNKEIDPSAMAILVQKQDHPLIQVARLARGGDGANLTGYDKVALDRLKEIVYRGVSRDANGNLTEEAVNIVKSFGEGNKLVAESVLRDVRHLIDESAYEDALEEIVKDIKDLDDFIDVTEEIVEDVKIGEWFNPSQPSYDAWANLGNEALKKEALARLKNEGQLGDIVPDKRTLKTFKDVGLPPKFAKGAWVKLQDGTTALIEEADGVAKGFWYRDMNGRRAFVEWSAKQEIITKSQAEKITRRAKGAKKPVTASKDMIETIRQAFEDKKFIDEMASLGVKEIK